jgi:peroxiredoxin
MSGPLQVGEPAPDLTLPSHLGGFETLSSFHGASGKNTVLFFYPLDWTPV